jgi:hypothetical protein
LDSGIDDIDSKNVFKVNKLQLIEGKRPVRNYLHERYLRETEVDKKEDVCSEKNSENTKVDLSPFAEQQKKYLNMKQQQRLEM